jgi:hypothetical protein
MRTFCFCLIAVVFSLQSAAAAPPENASDQVTMFTEGRRPMLGETALTPTLSHRERELRYPL